MTIKRDQYPHANRNGPLLRRVAAVMLVLLLPATVGAAPLRYCTGLNGHRAIEFAHHRDGYHQNTHLAPRPRSQMTAHSTFDVHGPNCHDKPLLPVAAKWEKRDHEALRQVPVQRQASWLNPWAKFAGNPYLKSGVAASRARYADPRLRPHRTIVLLI